MSKILADRDIKNLIGSILIDVDPNRINPNGIELRLGKFVRFHSTGEEKELEDNCYLKVSPGETVIISSFEQIDFSKGTVEKIFPNQSIMALITPTTTMMREGISQASTKIDAGFKGTLNWGLRNGSTNDLIVKCGEPIFKLTLFLLDENETPDSFYGERINDKYQNTEGIKRSERRIPVDIPKNKIVSSSFAKLDPKKKLREAGYPFDHIGTELTELQGKFEIVSKDVLLLKDQFETRLKELGGKIDQETKELSDKFDETRITLIEKVESLFDRKFIRIAGVIIGALPVMYGGINYLQEKNWNEATVSFLTILAGVVIITLTYFFTKNTKIS